jgi:hypothetical protein
VFDMDGTLTLPGSIDFARMYERAGVKRGSCILSHARAASEAERARIFAVIDEEERVGMDRCELQAGLVEAMASVDALKLPRGALEKEGCGGPWAQGAPREYSRAPLTRARRSAGHTKLARGGAALPRALGPAVLARAHARLRGRLQALARAASARRAAVGRGGRGFAYGWRLAR